MEEALDVEGARVERISEVSAWLLHRHELFHFADDVMIKACAIRARPRVHAEPYLIRLVRFCHHVDGEKPDRHVGFCRILVVDDLFHGAFFDEFFHFFKDKLLLDGETVQIFS